MTTVSLHIYDITNSPSVKTNSAIVQINKITRDSMGIGGIFHGAVEVAGGEWSYGYCEKGSGVFCCEPKSNPMYTFRETIELGVTPYDEERLSAMIAELSAEWRGRDYDLLQHNCNHFCDALAQKIGAGKIPLWVNRFAYLGDSAAEFANNSAVQIARLQEDVVGATQAALRFIWGEPPTHQLPPGHQRSASGSSSSTNSKLPSTSSATGGGINVASTSGSARGPSWLTANSDAMGGDVSSAEQAKPQRGSSWGYDFLFPRDGANESEAAEGANKDEYDDEDDDVDDDKDEGGVNRTREEGASKEGGLSSWFSNWKEKVLPQEPEKTSEGGPPLPADVAKTEAIQPIGDGPQVGGGGG
eukprot:TRINITY_DN12613_c0_g1_i1.p1 TRINITY_DN12613_c0_g1~~TRINITY_DN12613_c0_g1_i1.p1  ORF type:complete len:358 (+),score=66.78 TRINITY_DN12613_c0_g1_i1:612-1685(+)